MHSQDGNGSALVDAHIALGDARPKNQRTVHGKQLIDCLDGCHTNPFPAEAEADETGTPPRGVDETPAAHERLVTA